MTVGGTGYVAALLLAAIFAFAGIAKLRDHAGVVADFAAMGLRWPERLARWTPIVELFVAVLLVAAGWVGAAGALALLAAFTMVLVRLVRSGSTASCACFGALAASPISSWHLVRNALLTALAVWATFAVRAVPSAADVVLVAGLSAAAALVVIRGRSVAPR